MARKFFCSNNNLKLKSVQQDLKKTIFFPQRIRSSILTPSPAAVVAAIGRSKNDQPIGVTEHSRCVQSFEDPLQQYDGVRDCFAVDVKKTLCTCELGQ